MKTISFEDLGLDDESLEAVALKGYENPTPIQLLSIPRLLNGDANLVARARTGTGKTAAFALPMLQKLRGRTAGGEPLALVLAPTRELALQDAREIESLAGGALRICTVYGGQSMGEQLRALKRGVEIVVGTPGRVLDHLKRGTLKLGKIEFFILDEGDEMLDMGFIEDIESIFSQANPESRTLLFSATMPPQILKIAAKFMGEYEVIEEETPPEAPVLTKQTYWIVREQDKIEALVRLIDTSPGFYGLVFTQTKVDADAVCRELDERGYDAQALHGDIPQGQREKILARFRKKKTRILVATDVAARGIDIEGITHVVNYAIPFDSVTYVHRIGRTGRAGAEGEAFSLVRPEERRKLEYLKQAAQKATKGKMIAGKPPAIEEVLKAKADTLVRELCGGDSVPADPSPVDDAGVEGAAEGFCAPEHAAGDLPPALEGLARELTDRLGAEEALRRALLRAFGDALDAERYGEITEFTEKKSADARPSFRGDARQDFRGDFREKRPGGRSSFRSFADAPRSGERQIRLYVGLGRRDGYGPRETAQYFSGLLGIPQRFVDRIEVTENFSLVSLPYQAGMSALDRSRQDKRLPHMHIDVKDGSPAFYRERSGFRKRA
ncbi:MAG: DEAD/DEAH box helicase [Spirochaetaceae bacterium]|jgi:ATP-dependent RNA helicase DeaD|nr:DEAD/DEAH box helicase [Spirochaetaceae bacterium]